MGGGTINTREEFEKLCMENIMEFVFGKGIPKTPVNRPKMGIERKKRVEENGRLAIQGQG